MFKGLVDNSEAFFLQVKGLNPYLLALILLVFSIVVGLAARASFAYFLRTYAHQSGSIFARSLSRHLGPRTRIFFPLLIFFLLQPFINLPDEYDQILFKTIQTLLILVFGWLLLKLTRVFEDVASEYYGEDLKNPFKARKILTQLQFIRRILSVVIAVLVISAVLLTFDSVREVGATLLTSAGVAGIIVGIAAQKSLANLLAGMQIAMTQPIKIDDALLVEGEWGRVEEITLTYVVVMLWDKRRLILPITYFIEKPFQNWTRSSNELTGVVMLYVDYSLPVDAIREELDRILEEEPLWDRNAKVVQVVETTDRVMVVRILVSAGDAPTAFTLRCNVREKLIKFIQEKYPESLPKNRVSLMESKPLRLQENGGILQEYHTKE